MLGVWGELRVMKTKDFVILRSSVTRKDETVTSEYLDRRDQLMHRLRPQCSFGLADESGVVVGILGRGESPPEGSGAHGLELTPGGLL